MVGIRKWLSKRLNADRQSEDRQSAPEPAPKDYTKPEHFSYSAQDLLADPDAFNAAFDSANAKAHNGEPYGIALYMALREVSGNSQFLDDLVDELPNWAFAEHVPGAHMTHVLLSWSCASENDEKAQHACFRFWAIMCGWRPGDANAIWLDYRIGITDIPPPSTDPLGRGHLPENLIIAPNEVQVYTVLSGKAEEVMARGETDARG